MRTRLFIAAGAALMLITGIAPATHAGQSDVQTIRVYHQAVSPISISGSGVGTVRTFFIPMAVNGRAADNQYLTGTLTTLATGVTDGLELRGSNLTFVFGSEPDQLVVGGISLYPTDAATLAPGTTTVRPVIGGSGRFFAARGQVTSTNLGANGWTHVFRIRTS
jgi:hypothetical protein